MSGGLFMMVDSSDRWMGGECLVGCGSGGKLVMEGRGRKKIKVKKNTSSHSTHPTSPLRHPSTRTNTPLSSHPQTHRHTHTLLPTQSHSPPTDRSEKRVDDVKEVGKGVDEEGGSGHEPLD